jgi:hypothetical protein
MMMWHPLVRPSWTFAGVLQLFNARPAEEFEGGRKIRVFRGLWAPPPVDLPRLAGNNNALLRLPLRGSVFLVRAEQQPSGDLKSRP